ncbi:MAG: ZIP family metal transporter [Candidatus Paceibacterota bacterium]
MIEILLYSLGIMVVSLTGVILLWGNAGRLIERNLSFLVSFSAGVFLVVTYLLASETIEGAASTTEGLLWIIAGVVGVWLLFKILPEMEHHHEGVHSHSKIDPRRILMSDGIHNVADGILLAASFIVSSSLGMIAALSIFIHELLQEISEFFILRAGGYSIKRALSLNFLVSGTILIGALGGFFLIDSFEVLEIPLLGIASGSFLVVVLSDLIPHSLHHAKMHMQQIQHIVWFLLGIMLMVFISTSFAEPEHGHEEELDHENQTIVVE